jgi:hypothetical protein
MGKRTLVQVTTALAFLALACGRDGLIALSDSGGHSGSMGGAAGAGGIVGGAGGIVGGTGGIVGGAGGIVGGAGGIVGGAGGIVGGAGGIVGGGGEGGSVFRLPDGGLSTIFGDGGILAGILDAPRDSLLGQIICGSQVKLGAPCSSATPGCVLPSFGGACACVGGTYLCPLNTDAPRACPAGAATGTICISPLSACIGGSANGCICGQGTYICF